MFRKFEKLLREGRIERFEASLEEIEDLIQIAQRDIEVAEKVMGFDWDWAFVIAYNSVLQAGRAYILSKGFRVKTHQAHKTVFEFLRLSLPREHLSLIKYFDKIRIKRHKTLYEISKMISEEELQEIFEKARKFLKIIKANITT